MSQRPIRRLDARFVVIESENIDTDQIIPARYLKGTTRAGLGTGLFSDWRYHPDGEERSDFVLNQPHAEGAEVLVAGHNFGCGSSREHAPWALLDHGFRAVVSTGIADIFRANSLKNGLLPVVVDYTTHARMLDATTGTVTIDLEEQALVLEDGTRAEFPIDPFAKHCLLNGVDELGFLLDHEETISEHESRIRGADAAG
jgi:3-isopropylmalate/(R)-2-methylmalate dehydratase small subunit